MANPKHLAALKKGGEYWNVWRQEHPELRFGFVIADISETDLSGADLRGSNLSDADLRDSDLSGANLRDTNLRDTNLTGVNFSKADLCGIYLSGIELSGLNFSNTDFSRANLSDAYFRRANLSNADLSDANLSRADLSDANLSRANFSNANLSGADLSRANFSNANLSGANLSRADLSGAKFIKANLSKVRLNRTIFANNDLSTVEGMVEIHHLYRSYVELHTVKLPQDGSALNFLRGIGLADEWIDFYRTTMMHPIQYYSCFISYSSEDDILARRLHADLQSKGVRCWFAPHDMKIGDKIRDRINEAIHVQDKLLLLLSEHAIDSGWVEDEVEAALEKERKQKREVLFPVRIDEVVMNTRQAWAATLRRTRHIGDFTRWTEPEIYEQVFERLLQDLKAESR